VAWVVMCRYPASQWHFITLPSARRRWSTGGHQKHIVEYFHVGASALVLDVLLVALQGVPHHAMQSARRNCSSITKLATVIGNERGTSDRDEAVVDEDIARILRASSSVTSRGHEAVIAVAERLHAVEQEGPGSR